MEPNGDTSSQETPLLRTPPASTESLTPRRTPSSQQQLQDATANSTATVQSALNTGSTNNDGEDNGDDLRRRRITVSRLYRRFQSTVAHILVDEEGTGWPVVYGLLTLLIIGSILGAILPKDASLPPRYRTVSAAIGYTYFMCWSVSFYPQAINNYRRKTTVGLSPDFCGLNVLGFACYATYNCAMFWSSTIDKEYHQRYGEKAQISVQSNDVAFAVHAFCLASLTLGQIGYYNGFRGTQRPSKMNLLIMIAIGALALLFPILVLTVESIQWLDYLYLLSYVKVVISVIKYVPQVILNYRRQSTVGWSIWNIILDFSGGMLSDLQLILDCTALGDFSGITGNLAKFGLGSVSIVFDIIFMLQHYVLYSYHRATAGSHHQRILAAEDGDDGNENSGEQVEEPLAAIDECNL
jgi:cystinosin